MRGNCAAQYTIRSFAFVRKCRFSAVSRLSLALLCCMHILAYIQVMSKWRNQLNLSREMYSNMLYSCNPPSAKISFRHRNDRRAKRHTRGTDVWNAIGQIARRLHSEMHMKSLEIAQILKISPRRMSKTLRHVQKLNYQEEDPIV